MMKKVKLKKNLKDKVINYSKSNILITSDGRRFDLIKSFKSSLKKDINNYLKSKLYYLEEAVGCINLQLMKKDLKKL